MPNIKKQVAKKSTKPYLAAAFFCENVIEDKKDGSLTAIRMIDQINIALDASAPPNFPSKENRISLPICGLLAFKTGDAPGEHELRVVMESPSGKMNEPRVQVLPFTSQPHGGANLVMRNIIQVYKGGTFWLHIFLDGEEITRMPLLISIQRIDPPPTAATNGKKKKRS